MSLFTIEFPSSEGGEEDEVFVPFRPKKEEDLHIRPNRKRLVGNNEGKKIKQPIEPVRVIKEASQVDTGFVDIENELREDTVLGSQPLIQINPDVIEEIIVQENTAPVPLIEPRNKIPEPAIPVPIKVISTAIPKNMPKVYNRKENPIYRVARESSINIRGKRTFFSLFNVSEFLYSAKYKSGSDIIPIVKGQTVHVDGPMDACITVGNKETDFGLRMKSKTGDELLVIRFSPPEANEIARKLVCSIFASGEDIPSRLFSRQPTVQNMGKLTFDFGGRFHIISVKNAVLYDKNGKENIIWIRKTGEDVLEIEVARNFDHLIVFALGIASFISSVK